MNADMDNTTHIRDRFRLGRGRRRAYTLIEVLTIIAVLGIVIGIVMPLVTGLEDFRLREAARLLAADIELAQVESITHPDDPRVIVFDDEGATKYWIAPASDTSEGNAITDDISGNPYVVEFGLDRGSAAGGVVIESYSIGGDDELAFDAFGSPDQSSTATITLTLNGQSIEVQVAPETGEVTIDLAP